MKTVDELLNIMVSRNASDLHIKAGSPPVVRVDGELELLDEPALSPEDTKDAAASIMTDKQIRRFSEHNEIDFAYSAPNIGRFRVNIYRQRGSISIAMRQVATQIPSFEELHLPEIIKRLALEPRGLVLVTGTTGSGKTTTLAAMIDHINNTLRRHIVTIEDPIEVLHRTARRSSTSARSASTPSRTRQASSTCCARTPTTSSSARCATSRRSRPPSPRPRPATS